MVVTGISAAARPGCDRAAPQAGIEIAEQAGRVVVPAPPQVPGQTAEPFLRRRDELTLGAGQADDVRQLMPGRVIAATIAGSKERALTVCTTSTPCRSPRSTSGTPRNERYGSSPASLKYLKRGCARCVVDDERLQGLGDEADQALVEPHADAADAVRPEADRRSPAPGSTGRDRAGSRTDVGAETPLNQLDDVGERLGGVAGGRREAADVVERPRGRRRMVRCGMTHDVQVPSPVNGRLPRGRLRPPGAGMVDTAVARAPWGPRQKKRALPRPGSSGAAATRSRHFAAGSGRSGRRIAE